MAAWNDLVIGLTGRGVENMRYSRRAFHLYHLDRQTFAQPMTTVNCLTFSACILL